MNHLLIIQAQNSPELPERILRIVRHRGFKIQKFVAESNEDQKILNITLNVFSDRPVSLLSKQIEKTFGIIQVTILEHNSNQQAFA
ncbi:MAG: acetolactate synthase 2 small subunit [Psychromonas sp.]